MRSPADFSRTRRVRGSPRSRVFLVVLVVALFLLSTSVRGIAGFWTDYLWFDSLQFSGVFTGVLRAKVLLGVIFSGLFFVLLLANLTIADRLAPRFRPLGPEEEVLERYHELVGNRTGLVRVVVAGLFAVIAGAGVPGQWNAWILFTNAQTVGENDPQFGTDIGFYLFRLPFLTFVVDWARVSFVIILIVTAVAHYLNGGIRLQGAVQRVTPQVKGHISVLLGVLALLYAGDYWLRRYELNFSSRGVVDGATYTDVNAELPALNLLILISLAAFGLFIVNIWRRGWVLPAIGVGLWAFVALVVAGLYPAFIQRFRVEPAESSREAPYIERNIAATRNAIGLRVCDGEGGGGEDCEMTVSDFPAEDGLDAQAIDANDTTVSNIRLWDPTILERTYQEIQGLRDFYRINDVDVDRYQIDGETTQVVLSARELDTSGVPQDSWEARTLTYTHGYGVVLSPANSKTPEGRPELLLRDIPVSQSDDIPLDQPGIYIGEGLTGYSVVGTDRREIDFQDENGEQQFATYKGQDGVGIGSYLRRSAFALRFGDINPLISGNLRNDSKILFQRDVSERVRTLAPFLSFDADPYPVIAGGDLKYVIDAYTTSSRYPYGQSAETRDLESESGLNHSFNYVRNSVKAVVDAYDGTVEFYVVDDTDPLVGAYRQAFPELFTDGDQVPDDVRAHYRYPEDLFRVQTNMWGRYHLETVDDFYTQGDAWNVSQDPDNAGEQGTSQAVDPQTGLAVGTRRRTLIDPYYQVLELPGEEAAEFVLVRPFVPATGDDSGRVLTALMVARSDGDAYGQLQTYEMPRNNPPDGPSVVAATIGSNPAVSELETLLGSVGSELLPGDLLTLPIDESLLYVRPIYVESTSTRIPELERVVVAYEGAVEVAETLELALRALFLEADEVTDPPPDETDDPPEVGGNDPVDVPSLLADADAAFARADAALVAGDLAGFQQEIVEARRLLALARAASGDLTAPAAPTTTTTEVTAQPAGA